ncbi:tectonic-2 [Aplochiton taeniatus]
MSCFLFAGLLPPPSCVAEPTQWDLTSEVIDKTTVRVQLRLNRSLVLCDNNDTDIDCCPKPLCVLEALHVSACLGDTPQATLLVQVKIYAFLFPTGPQSDNITVIPNQVYQPLGTCPCNLTPRACDVRCCCDRDCSLQDLKLFDSKCFPGPFGGQVSPTPDYQCSAQSSENAPDWFPFLCVNSPSENNPYLGLFYQGNTITPKPSPSFQSPVQSAPLPMDNYRQGDPIFTTSNQYFTIPQNSLIGQCAKNAPVGFLDNFNVRCVTRLVSCPSAPPLLTTPADLSVHVKDGLGGVVTVEVVDKVVVDLKQFVDPSVSPDVSGQLCENVTLALDYQLFWRGNGITNITLTRTLGNVQLNGSVILTARYSSVFLNGDFLSEANSGNPGYQVGRPVIGGFLNTVDNDTEVIQRTSINLWRPVNDGMCDSAETRAVLYGENSTAGCLLPINLTNLTQCDLLRENIALLQAALGTATYVATRGNPDSLNVADWVNITFMAPNSSTPVGGTASSCSGIPAHQQIHIQSIVTEVLGGVPQRQIQAMDIKYGLSTWKIECGGGESSSCTDPSWTFPVTSSVTFTDILVNTGPPKTRFKINFTEYDCDRNDVCWPQLAFPLTRYYTGEPYSLCLAKGLILVFFFLAASILGTPWKQIRQAWNSASL